MFNPDQDQLSSLEERLRLWVPSAGGLDRERMLFEAGRADGRARLWKLATAASILLASGLGVGWIHERGQRRAPEPENSRTLPPAASSVSTPEIVTQHREPETVIDPSSYLGLIRQLKRLEGAADFEPHRAAPHSASKVHSAVLPSTTPLRPYDFDRVISL